MSRHIVTRVFVSLLILLAAVPSARAHCDALDGPVVLAARQALDDGDLDPVLRWVEAGDEAAIRSEFELARDVRELGDSARDLADRHFLETLVRIHRAGEGAPYTGLKPAGGIDPAVAMADEALLTGRVRELVDALGAHLARGVEGRFETARASRAQAGDSVADGRAHVSDYVAFVHYVETLHRAIAGSGHDH